MHTLPLLVSVFLLITVTACGAANLLTNPGFEQGLDAKGLPQSWWLWEQNPGKAKCALDTAICHSGKQSFRMEVPEGGHSLLVASGIPVSEGEKFDVSIWVRAENVVPENNSAAVVVNAAFVRADGKFVNIKRFGKLISGGQWLRLSAEATVPEDVSTLTMEIGLRDAHGTVWFDDASVVAKSPFSIRPAGAAAELPPGSSQWSIEVLNRTGQKREASVRIDHGSFSVERKIQLDGSVKQDMNVPIRTEGSGRQVFTLRLLDSKSGDVLAETSKEMRVLKAVELEPLVPTHFCIEDGKPSLEARVWNNLPESAAELTVVLKDAAGNVIDSKSVQPVKTGWQDVELTSNKAGLGEYTVEARLKASNGKIHTASQPWHVIHRSQARVTLNEAGFPVADGQAIFPLGTFNSGRYELMHKLGFTVTHAWNRMKLASEGERTDNQQALDYLDETQKAGMKAIGFLHVAYMERQDWDGLRRRIRMFRNHPVLLAWDQEEGVARGEVPVSRLEKLVRIVREEDKNHPLVMADSYDEITKVDRTKFFREDLMDAGMWWYYPIPLNPGGKVSALEGQDSTDSLTLNPPTFLVSTKKPLWVGLQAYSREVKDGRLPTDAEYRCMAYLSVVNGAKGLLYYMGGSAWRVEGGTEERPWGYLHELVPELHSMLPVFMSPTAPDQVSVDTPNSHAATLLKLNGRTYTLIVVNQSEKPVDITLSAGCFGSRSVEVLFENRSIRAESGKLKDRFEGYGVHVYRFAK